jgi:branched-chain amino acid transport system permease protein
MPLFLAVQLTIGGLTVGCIYALVALGFHIIYKGTGAINFAQGEQVMFSGFIALTFGVILGLPLPLVFLITLLSGIFFGWVYERVAIRRVLNVSQLAIILVSVAVAIILENGGALIWGKEEQPFPAFSGETTVTFLGAGINPQSFWIMGLTLTLVVILHLFFTRTNMGTSIQAAASNPTAARLVGISPERVVNRCFIISSALAACVGITAAPILMVGGPLGTLLALKGFAAAVVGGLTSSMGVVVGGLLLGLLEFFVAFYISQGYRDAIAFSVLILALVFRPQGLFGGRD